MPMGPLSVLLAELSVQVLISIDAEKAFDKAQHPLMIKTLSKVGIEGAFLNTIRAIYMKPMANICTKTKSFPPKVRNKTRMSVWVSFSCALSKECLLIPRLPQSHPCFLFKANSLNFTFRSVVHRRVFVRMSI